jgi:hypothetical protein
MFGLFKRSSWKLQGKALFFFQKLFEQLPNEYSYLLDGLNLGLYNNFRVNFVFKPDNYSIGFNPKLSDISMIKGRQFILENILIYQNNQTHIISLTIYDGLWIGFESKKNVFDFDGFEIDISKMKKSKLKYLSDELNKLVDGLTCDDLELSNLGEIEVGGRYYYQIKDLNDGNYIVIDKKGQVYGLIHDPYKIELLNKSLVKFVEEVNSGQFKLNDYLNK